MGIVCNQARQSASLLGRNKAGVRPREWVKHDVAALGAVTQDLGYHSDQRLIGTFVSGCTVLACPEMRGLPHIGSPSSPLLVQKIARIAFGGGMYQDEFMLRTIQRSWRTFRHHQYGKIFNVAETLTHSVGHKIEAPPIHKDIRQGAARQSRTDLAENTSQIYWRNLRCWLCPG